MEPADVFWFALEALRWGLLLTAVVFVAGTIAAETRMPQWPLRMCDFPRSQVAILSLVVAVLYMVTALPGGLEWWDWVVPIALVLATIRQAMWIRPYVLASEKDIQSTDADPTDDHALRIVISNVLQQNDQYDLWREVITAADPDVLACAETDERWIREIGQAFDADYPHRVTIPQGNMYGMAIWSRLPLEDIETEYLVQPDIPSIHAKVVLRNGRRICLHCLHPRPPAPQEGDSSSPRDAELIVVARRIAKSRDDDGAMPTVVVGDLNDVAWSRTTDLFLRISGMLDPRRGRGLFNSFHAEHWWVRFPLDHVFVSRDFRLIDMRRLDYVGSDHFPMCIDIALEPDAKAEQPRHEIDEEDREEATETIETEIEREQEGDEDGHLHATPEADEAKKDQEAVPS